MDGLGTNLSKARQTTFLVQSGFLYREPERPRREVRSVKITRIAHVFQSVLIMKHS